MKTLISCIFFFVILNIMFISCEEKTDEGTPPELPPYESMFTDFSKFTVNKSSEALPDFEGSKSALLETRANWQFAAGNVTFWNTLLTVTLAVPVASFYSALSHEPEFLGNATWHWGYTVEGFFGTYTARLTGEIRREDVKWEMYITKTGIEAFSEFLWFEGTSDLDGNGGEWLLYHSPQFNEEALEIEWKRNGEKIGEITYTVVRELDDERNENLFNGSYLTMGLLEGDMDAYYSIHFYEIWIIKDFVDVNIEWDRSEYNGRVKAPHKYTDGEWHCWDSFGYDVVCE